MAKIVCVEVVDTEDGTVSRICAPGEDAETAWRILRRAVRAQGGITQVASGRTTAVGAGERMPGEMWR